jgi:DNA mismatch repair protein MutS
VGRVNPRELLQLKNALQAVDALKILLQQQTPSTEAIKKIAEQLNPCHLIVEKIEKAIDENSPSMVAKGGVICSGYNEELDDLRNIQSNGKNYLLQIQQLEIENTGIASLKVAFNNVFGYYLEVTNVHKNKVPETWMRKQTLANAERYITEELKVYEEKIMGAEDKIAVLELNLYNAIVTSLLDYIAPIQLNASLLAQLDCLASFSITAQKNNYTKPTLNDTNVIDIKNGRHPVIEKQLPITETYVANDVYLDNDQQQIIMITGPNMSGKSAILRQTALIVIMAQIGSYVPATHANLGLIDKVFTRVGASDNISSGESTFMVEMNETASIMNNLSNRSLVLLDEIGRGTSTYDGISIAWAIAEYLHEHNFAKAKTLFATHYHELNEMTNNFPRIKNFNVSVQDTGNKVIFLRKLQQGGSHHSFGIHVAKMAGMPSKIITRANTILQTLEETHNNPTQQAQKELAKKKEEYQLSFFQLDDPVLSQIKDELKHIDINTLTPVEALIKLNEIKKLVGGN